MARQGLVSLLGAKELPLTSSEHDCLLLHVDTLEKKGIETEPPNKPNKTQLEGEGLVIVSNIGC